MTIPELIARIEELDRKATGGNWYTFMYSRGKDDPKNGALVAAVAPGHQIRTDKGGGTCPAFDQDFIAASRTLLPLCAKIIRIYQSYAENLPFAEIEEMRAELAAAMEVKDAT